MGTILNDDATLSIADVSQSEDDAGATTFVFSVTLSAATDTSIAADYATADDSATVFETGPFRWFVYAEPGGELLGASEAFYLPERTGQVVIVDLMLP